MSQIAPFIGMPTITQEQWDSYKSQFPNDKKIQSVTLEELLKNTDGGKVDWKNPPIATKGSVETLSAVSISACELAVGYVIFDVICLAIGGVSLRSSVNRETAEAIAEAAAPVLSKIEADIAKIAAQEASYTDIAWAVFDILKTIWSGGCLGAVLSAFLGSLTWYYALLYGATAMATIVAALATDGAAFVAEVVIELATFGFLVADSVNAVETCS